MNSIQKKNQHLFWRAGFGPAIRDAKIIGKEKPENLFKSILKSSEKKPSFFDVADPSLKEMVMSIGGSSMQKFQRLKPEQKQMLRKQSVLDIAKLNTVWLQEMTGSEAQLREKMSLFWHGHFATRTVNIIYDQELLNIIRENALGNFRDLLFKVSKSASMIQFLNNSQNKKDHPNENFARELMELFTLGRGNYSEADVKESARAFTGWSTNIQGEFEFRARVHDPGVKNFMGKTGNFGGEDILNIILDKRITAVFITKKIYRFFVSEIADDRRIELLANDFFQSGYDISLLLNKIFTSSWFFDQQVIGSQIKSPVLWLVGMRRQLPMEIQNPSMQIILERLLGQVLFNPPNVAGWPGGKQWIDSSSLMLRMQIPNMIYHTDVVLSKPKDDDDTMMGLKERLEKPPKHNATENNSIFQTKIRWDQYMPFFGEAKDPFLFEAIQGILLQQNTNMTETEMNKFIDESSRQKRIETITIRLMCTPEYQLC